MAMQRPIKYQYETSPRKLQPEYRPARKKYPPKSTAPKQKTATPKISAKKKEGRKKLVISLMVLFAVIFTISYRNSQIDEAFRKGEEMKQAYLEIEKENDQLKVDIEDSLNYNNIEQAAKEKLGMQKLSNKQTIYINLPKRDYIQPATEDVVINENEGFFTKIINSIMNLF